MTSAATSLAGWIEDADAWRGAIPTGDANAPFKEWQHFVLFIDSATLLFNLSMDDERARTLVVFADDAWRGELSSPARPVFRRGRIDATFGAAGMRWCGDRYEIWSLGGSTRFEAVVVPVCAPSVSHHIPVGQGAFLSWCLVPRLVASGWLEHEGRRVGFDRCSAYHDHNWGRFGWGGDFSWEWGCAMPDDGACPWSLVFSRMCDGARRTTRAASMFVVRGDRHERFFRDAEVRFDTEGVLLDVAARIPPAAALLCPDEDHDVAASVRVEARREHDEIRVSSTSRVRGQVLVPSDGDLRRVARLNEVATRVEVEGRCGGRAVRFQGAGLLEVVRG